MNSEAENGSVRERYREGERERRESEEEGGDNVPVNMCKILKSMDEYQLITIRCQAI